MVTSAAVVRGDRSDLLDFSPQEHPVALQLGGSDPAELAEACRVAADFGYDEINLNVGCPSDRVQSGSFGAVLMERPELVAACVEAMAAACDIEITVKCRIGVDDQDPDMVLPDFLTKIRNAGVQRVTIHARKAWLQGLSPKQNRDVPPLDYPLVYRMKQQFPDMHLSLNGGLQTLDDAVEHLRHLDGVMFGRAAYHTPWDVLGTADARVFGDPVSQTPFDVVRAMEPYIERHIHAGGKLGQVTRHMLGLFAGRPGARAWRRVLSEGAHKDGAGVNLLREALDRVEGGDLQSAQ